MQLKPLKLPLTPCLLFLCLCLSNCGRKQKNIFLFGEQELPKVSKLSLPAVHGITAQKTSEGNLITWFEVELPQIPAPATPNLCTKYFAGYNVYRLVRTNIIPKHPCNKKPLKKTAFIDRKGIKGRKPLYYLIRAVFNYNNTITEGPTSLIVRINP